MSLTRPTGKITRVTKEEEWSMQKSSTRPARRPITNIMARGGTNFISCQIDQL